MFDIFKKKKDEQGKLSRPYYSIRSVHADKVLDIEQNGQHKGLLTIYKPWNGDNQCFTFIPDQNGWYLIRCKAGNKYLTVDNANDGAKVFLADKSGNQNQRFKFSEPKEGSKDHMIETFCGKALDILENKKNDGAVVSQYTKNGGKNQLWNFCDPKDVTSSSSHND